MDINIRKINPYVYSCLPLKVMIGSKNSKQISGHQCSALENIGSH